MTNQHPKQGGQHNRFGFCIEVWDNEHPDNPIGAGFNSDDIETIIRGIDEFRASLIDYFDLEVRKDL